MSTTDTAPRVTVTHGGDGTTAEVHGGRADDEARDAVKAAGFRWSRNLGAWFLPRVWHVNTRAERVRRLAAALPGVVVEDAGHEVTSTAAEREELQRERAEGRAERFTERAEKRREEAAGRFETARRIGDGIPFGQPILVGHHSERRHRRDVERIQANGRAGVELVEKAEHAERRAASAAVTAAGPSPRARLRRIERNEAEARKIARRLADSDTLEAMSPEKRQAIADRLGLRPISAEYRAQLEAAAAVLADELAHDRAEVDRAAVRQYAPSDVRKGDAVRYRGQLRRVVRVNRTTVSVETGYSWTDRAELHQVTAVYRPTTDDPNGPAALVEPAARLAALAAEAAAEEATPEEPAPDVDAQRAAELADGYDADAWGTDWRGLALIEPEPQPEPVEDVEGAPALF